ncbi:OsmC family peroxiredoxin [Arthrobacter sp. BL-252-APC-1A]|nr:OsmC family peroxiredoxin [Arthrobacter sp. BL-252-APC-1A]
MTQHTYSSLVVWNGTTAGGYRSYRRDHTASACPALQELCLSADPAFRGNPELLNPEQLLTVAASSCLLLSFLALASRTGLDIHSYQDRSAAVLDTSTEPVRVTEIVLSPTIHVTSGTDASQVKAVLESAHLGCYIANTLNCPVRLEPTVVEP